MSERYLTITLRSEWKSALRSAAQASTRADYQGETLNFESPAQFFGQLTERRWELVQLSLGKPPMALDELARLSGMDLCRVQQDVKVLTQLGLLERTEQAGVTCPYNRVY